jgi:acyl CoA:acetate/3-ketoacid CoA transferase beta subunit
MSLFNTGLMLPITVANDADPGAVVDVTAVVDDVSLDLGYYKIAAMGQPLLWKIGDDDVTTTTGSYLAAGDQEVIRIPADTTKLSYISATDASGAGQLNIVRVAFVNPALGSPENDGAPI